MRAAALALALAFISHAPARAATSIQRTPALRVLGVAPLTVQGLHFTSRELVRLTVLAPGNHQLIVRASRTGRFTARLNDLAVDRCTSLHLHAVGTHHDHALLKIRPLCPPP